MAEKEYVAHRRIDGHGTRRYDFVGDLGGHFAMSDAVSWEDLATVAAQLSTAEQLRLVERIVHGLAEVDRAAGSGRRRSGSEIRGRVAHPLCGEDAQTWITRERREPDEARKAALKSKAQRSRKLCVISEALSRKRAPDLHRR
jgi:hypothetical protein